MSRDGWDLGSPPRTCPTAIVAPLCSAFSLLHLGFSEWIGKVEVGHLGSRIGSTCFAFARERDLLRGADFWKFPVGEFFGLAE